jgi:HSP90 family molecular chaperone
MKESQKDIYVHHGRVAQGGGELALHREAEEEGLEVLFMVDPIDEYAVQQLKEYDGHKLVCATKEGLKLEESEEEKAKAEELKAQFEPLCRLMKDILGDKVEKCLVSDRIVRLALRAGHRRVRLVRQHGAHHEGAGAARQHHEQLHGVQEDAGDQPAQRHHGRAAQARRG